MSLLDLKSNLDNRNAFGGGRQTQSTFNVNGTLSQPDIPDPTVNEASIIDGGMGTTIEEKFFHGKADPGKTDGKKIGDLDLHVHLLNEEREYSRAGFSSTVGPAPGPTGFSDFQDLDIPINGDGTQDDPERYMDRMNSAGLL